MVDPTEKTVDELLEEYKKEPEKFKPLYIFSVYLARNPNVINLLRIIEDFKVDAKNTDTKTLLMYAAERGDIDMVKFLVGEKHAGVNISSGFPPDHKGKTALMFAAETGHLKVVEYLLEKGADINEKDGEGNTALIYAALNGKFDVFKYLIEIKNADTTDIGLILYSAAYNDVEIVRYILENYPQADVNDPEYPPMIAAASVGRLDIVKLLVDHGASIFIKDIRWRTPLDVANALLLIPIMLFV